MARTANPFVADAGPYAGIGQGINNLANVFLNSQPDPVRSAQAQAHAWNARESRENVLDSQDARQGRFQLGDQLAGFDPQGDNRQLYAQGIGTGAMNVDNLGKLMLGMNANFGGTDEQVARSMVGTGTALGENDFMSIPDREMGRERNAANDRALDRASMSLNERLGDAFASGQLSLEDIYSAQHPDRYANAAGGGGGAGGVDWLDATRRGTVEGDAYDAVFDFLADLGVQEGDYGQLPEEVMRPILDGAVQYAGQGGSPRAYVYDAMRNLNLDYTDDDNWLWGLGNSRLKVGNPNGMPQPRDTSAPPVMAQPQPTPTQPVTGPDATLQEAAGAIAKGADPGAVRARLRQMGYTDDQLGGL